MRRNLVLLVLLFCAAELWAAQTPDIVSEVDNIEPSGGKLLYKRGDKPWFRAYLDMDNHLQERLKTDEKTTATIKFLMGGQACLDKNTEIQLVGQRKAEVVTGNRLTITAGTVWAKVDKQKEELQVQTSGGVMGIKGTEFVVEVLADGDTRLSVLEGEVEVKPEQGEVYRAMAGSEATFGRRRRLVARRLAAGELRRHLEERLGPFGRHAPAALTRVRRHRLSRMVRSGRLQTQKARLRAQRRAGARRRAASDFPTGLSPLEERVSGKSPAFSWEPVSGAHRYVVLVGPSQDLEPLLWSASTEQTRLDYPADGEPLPPGRYYWRIMPVDERGNPVGQAAQSWFETDGWTATPAE